MKLKPVEREQPVLDRGDRAGRRRGQGYEIRSRVLDLVAVAHPDGGVVRKTMEERLGRVENLAFRAAEFSTGRAPGGVGSLDFTAQHLGRQLHAVADSQNRNAHPKERRITVGRSCLVDGAGATRENQSQRVELAYALGRDVVPDDPRKGMPLANAPRDELNVLGAEVED